MRITAVLTTYNRRKLLLEALASVRAQTRPPDEILIIDDGSTDGTRELMEGQELRYHWQPNAGTSAARNAGWRLATGGWIAYLDSDDLWEKEKLELQVQAAETSAGVGAIFGHALNFADSSRQVLFNSASHRLDVPLPCWLPGAALIRRDLMEAMGGFDPSLKIAEVVDWIMRLRLRDTPTILLPQLVLRRRLHGGNKQLEDGNQRENLMLLQRWRELRHPPHATP
jgi:glycosyltransferase involved in cell wall biosynthesis